MDTITAPFMRNRSKRAVLSARRFSPEAYGEGARTLFSKTPF
jgi:hypothetical protein